MEMSLFSTAGQNKVHLNQSESMNLHGRALGLSMDIILNKMPLSITHPTSTTPGSAAV